MKKIFAILLTCMLTVNMIAPVLAVTPHYNVHPYSFSIDQSEVSVKEGETVTLKASGSAATLGITSWKTSDDSVVAIQSVESGSYNLNKGYKVNLQAIKSGSVIITVRNTKNSDVLTCCIIVKENNRILAPVIVSANITGTTKAGSIKAAWNEVENAEKYQIQISMRKDFSTTYRDTVTKNTYYNTGWNYYNQVGAGTKVPYYCRVKAITIDGTESVWSNTATCKEK